MRLIDADALSDLLVKTYETAPTEKALLFVALLLKNNEQVPTVEAFTKDDMAGAYNEGWMCGNREAEKARPQGYFDISKLRLMTVEECAGHTIDYAMGWKACIEWIKKGGAE